MKNGSGCFPTGSTIHPSVLREGQGFMRWVDATQRPHGAVRYCCPVTGSFVLVTDDAQLEALKKPRAQVRCIDCGEMHLLDRTDPQDDVVRVIADHPANA